MDAESKFPDWLGSKGVISAGTLGRTKTKQKKDLKLPAENLLAIFSGEKQPARPGVNSPGVPTAPLCPGDGGVGALLCCPA